MKPKQNKEIEVLLARFENGETNSKEEEQLAQLLQMEEHRANYPEEATLFRYFQHERNENANPSYVKAIFDENSNQKKTISLKRNYIKPFYKYASILVIALGTLFFMYQYQQDRLQQKEAEMAYVQTKKALFLISQEMNNATEKLSVIEDFTKETQKFINP